LERDGRIYWGKNGDAEFPVEKKFLSEVKEGVVNQTWWPYDFAGSTRNASAEMKALFFGEKAFDTPKPEKLLYRILQLATVEGDLVLDSFAGSGTTGAVAHKMGRRWIMIEMGEHCHTHIIPRMKKVIDGTDQGGISKAVGWKGGGGFRYYRLAPTLIKKDAWGNEVINPQFNPEMVAEAVCKLEGFTYAPSETEFWRHGQSTENDFIYVTTQALSAEQLERISEEVGPKRSLLICCGAFKVKDPERFTNLTLKKLPKAVLDKAEWDKDDYSLQISQLPVVEEEPEEDEEAPVSKQAAKAKAAGQESLFDEAPAKVKKGRGRGK
jgi:adenine-specific DNA-methyltransferase